ncbi:MAG: hypothetical protein GY744_02720 [Gammaproteobacteria bacterium]|nr:hypothetical protein [Gammaproteobacteria bacterium]
MRVRKDENEGGDENHPWLSPYWQQSCPNSFQKNLSTNALEHLDRAAPRRGKNTRGNGIFILSLVQYGLNVE